MTKKLIILNSHYLTRHNFKIHGLDYFKKNSNCIIYDLSYLTSKLLKKNPKSYSFTKIHSLKEINSIFKSNKDSYFLDMLMSSPKAVIIRLMMHWYKLNVISTKYLSTFPKITYKSKIRLKSFYKLLSFTKFKIFLIDRIFNFILKEDINVCGGLVNNILYTKNKKLIYAASAEYSNYLYNKKKIFSRKYAIFSETNFLEHPDDFYKINNKQVIKPIYKKINLFFDRFCLLTGFDLIIAAHPTCSNVNQLKNLFPNYSVIKDKTADLLRKSQMLININSTTFALAVLYKKPILHLTSNLINDHLNNRDIISIISKELASTYIDVDDFMLNKKILNNKHFVVNKKKYQMYVDKYIKHPKSPELHWFETLSSQLSLSKFK
jgi:hypothetical protein